MKSTKKFIANAMLFTVLAGFSTTHIEAAEYCVDNGGCGYEECVRASSLAPAIALGAIVVVGIVAVAVQNTSGHAHCHVHN